MRPTQDYTALIALSISSSCLGVRGIHVLLRRVCTINTHLNTINDTTSIPKHIHYYEPLILISSSPYDSTYCASQHEIKWSIPKRNHYLEHAVFASWCPQGETFYASHHRKRCQLSTKLHSISSNTFILTSWRGPTDATCYTSQPRH